MMEDHSHILLLPWNITREFCEMKTDELKDELIALDTHPGLSYVIESPLLLDVSGHPEEEKMRAFMDGKNRLGCFFL